QASDDARHCPNSLHCQFPSLVLIPVFCLVDTDWWSRSGSNRRPQACKARALPTELRPHRKTEYRHQVTESTDTRIPLSVFWVVVGPGRVERPTSRLSGVRSNHLS